MPVDTPYLGAVLQGGDGRASSKSVEFEIIVPVDGRVVLQTLVHRVLPAVSCTSLNGHTTSSSTGGVRVEAGAAAATVAIVSSMVVHRRPLSAHRAPYSNSGRIVDARKSDELYLG